MKTFLDFGIVVPASAPDVYRTTCPQCAPHRQEQHRHLRCLTVWVKEGTWSCGHCQWGKGLSLRSESPAEERSKRWQPVEVTARTPDEEMFDWFWRERHIPRHVVERNRITQAKGAICFNYYADGVLVNVKFRTREKRMWQTEGGTPVLYGLDDVASGDVMILTEGEMDKLAYEAAGLTNVASIPGGAINEHDTQTAGKLKFLDLCAETFQRMATVYLAMDNDPAGLRTREEIARRLGKKRCMIVGYPDACKDANDVLMKFGANALTRTIDEAQPYPIQGIIHPEQLTPLLVEKRAPGAMTRGRRIGLPLDNLVTWQTPQLTVVTGIPNHGKSPMVDHLTMSLAVQHDWRIGYATFEHAADEHEQRLVEQLVGKPYSQSYNGAMTDAELLAADEFLRSHIRYVEPGDEDFTFGELMEHFEYLVTRHGINCLVIDPWGDIETTKSTRETSHEFIGKCLKRLRRFTKQYDVHVIVVAHPTKLPREKDSMQSIVPGLYNISDSSHWANKPDLVLSVYRRRDEDGRDLYNEAHVIKVKSKYVGTPGVADLSFDVRSQRFYAYGGKPDLSNWLTQGVGGMYDAAPAYETPWMSGSSGGKHADPF